MSLPGLFLNASAVSTSTKEEGIVPQRCDGDDDCEVVCNDMFMNLKIRKNKSGKKLNPPYKCIPWTVPKLKSRHERDATNWQDGCKDECESEPKSALALLKQIGIDAEFKDGKVKFTTQKEGRLVDLFTKYKKLMLKKHSGKELWTAQDEAVLQLVVQVLEKEKFQLTNVCDIEGADEVVESCK